MSASRSLRSALAGLALAAVVGAQAPTVTTVINNGTTQTRYDMVILGDGYQASQQAQFNADVNTFLTALFQRQPYATFAAYYNVHSVFRASVDSGADRPDETPPVFKTTAYEATYDYGGTDRCLYIQNTSLALADAALAPATEGRVLVLVNDSRYGGCASTFAVSYNGSQMNEVQIHELGHSLGQLADEYDYPNGTYTGGEPSAVNITTSPVGAKWSIWQGTDSISAFEGAGYYAFGLYRPKANCLMRSLGVQLCRVCQENIVRITNSIAKSIVATSPATAAVTVSVPTPQTFSITHIVPAGNQPLITWKLDGNVVAGATGSSYTLDPTTTTLGAHTLVASVKDQTPLVRTDPQNVMTETFTWNVTVDDPTLAQLRVPTASSNPIFVSPGGTATWTATIANDGPAAAGAFDVEFFLAPTTTWSPNDTYLGRVQVPALAVGQSTQVSLTASVPWQLAPVLQWVHVRVDRTNAVNEWNESDNGRTAPLVGQAGPCVTKLEYHTPLVTPTTASLSVAAGGVLHPTVVAPCVDPATSLYLIVLGAAGTTPGIALGPGVTLPLNYDVLLQTSLDAVNGPVFAGFLGLFDAAGIGHATFALPPAANLPLGTAHFAAVILGQSTLFAATTNPLELQLLP